MRITSQSEGSPFHKWRTSVTTILLRPEFQIVRLLPPTFVKRDCRTFGMRERTGFAGPKRVTAVEVPLQRIFTAKVVESLL